MSNAAILTSWGSPHVGRESKALEVFSQVLEFYATQKSKGKIADFRVYTASNGQLSEFGGVMLIEGSVQQCRDLVDTEDFQKLLLKAHHLVTNLNVVHMNTGDEIQKVIGRLLEVRKQLGII